MASEARASAYIGKLAYKHLNSGSGRWRTVGVQMNKLINTVYARTGHNHIVGIWTVALKLSVELSHSIRSSIDREV